MLMMFHLALETDVFDPVHELAARLGLAPTMS